MKSNRWIQTDALAFVAALALSVQGQNFPIPTPAQQQGIDKDTARHFGDAPAEPGPLAVDLSAALTPAEIDKATTKVADWELTRSQPYFDRIWTWSVLYNGFMAVSKSTGDPKYRDAMNAMSEKFDWSLRNRLPNADDQSIAQTYLELYLLNAKKDEKMIAPARSDLDSVIHFNTLKPGDPRVPWWWCDALFMAPPVWARMYSATGDHVYIDYLNKQWQQTSDTCCMTRTSTSMHATIRTKPGVNPTARKSSGHVAKAGSWAALRARSTNFPRAILTAFSTSHYSSTWARVVALQQADGLWTAALLDPEDYPEPEISGSALMLYAMTWGVNEGVLYAKIYRPVIEKAWRGILQHVYADGRLGSIQQSGAEPAYYRPSSSYNYGVGAYLLAATELKRMAIKQEQASAVSIDPGQKMQFARPANIKDGIRTIWLVGDSTVRNGRGDGANHQMGWGDELAPYFNTDKVNIVNRAIGVRSLRTYITDGHWADVLQVIKSGDVVLIQFGHNDGGPINDTSPARGSLPGIGDESRDIYNPILKRQETVHTFGWYMTKYAVDAKTKGATPIFCSLIPRKIWKDGKIIRGASTYGGWTRDVATAQHADFIDLNEITARKSDALGPSAVEPLFGDPHPYHGRRCHHQRGECSRWS